MKCGIVGLPNVGKSTLFNALTLQSVQSSNYPFCTINPNVGVVSVKDHRLDRISEIFKPEKVTPTTIEFYDIAGLVKGASKGEGLGNQFLSHIREVDIIIHVVRCFEDLNITHVSNTIDPIRDIEIINTELLLSDLKVLETKLSKLTQKLKGDKSIKLQVELIEELLLHVEEGKTAKNFDKISDIEDVFLLTSKPIIYLCNVDENKKFVDEVKKKFGIYVLQICSKIEEEISKLEEDEKATYLKSMDITESGLDKLVMTSYKLLDLITFFTAGKKEVRAWSIAKNTNAPKAAGKIHSDFEKGFIRADKYHFNDLVTAGSENNVRLKGLYRSEGRDYIVQDGDILFFKVN